MKQFESLLKSEIKKIEKYAQQRDGKDSRLTGYGSSGADELGFVDVRCEICSNGMTEREQDVIFSVFMPDRRRSFVCEALNR